MESIKAREVAPGSWQVWDPNAHLALGKTIANTAVAVFEYRYGWSCEVHPSTTIPCEDIATAKKQREEMRR